MLRLTERLIIIAAVLTALEVGFLCYWTGTTVGTSEIAATGEPPALEAKPVPPLPTSETPVLPEPPRQIGHGPGVDDDDADPGPD